MTPEDVSSQNQPVLRVVRGDATAEELAVLIALASARGGSAEAEPEVPARGRWNDPAHVLRRELPRHGFGGWLAAR